MLFNGNFNPGMGKIPFLFSFNVFFSGSLKLIRKAQHEKYLNNKEA